MVAERGKYSHDIAAYPVGRGNRIRRSAAPHRQALEELKAISKTRDNNNERPELKPEIAPEAPSDPELTPYDRTHLITYLRLLDADVEGAPWDEVARIVLAIDPVVEPQAARRAHETHLRRARWMTEAGYKLLLQNARQG